MTGDLSRLAARRVDPGPLSHTMRILLAALAACVVFIGGPRSAQAHHANVGIDNVTCTGLVTFTIEAWDGGDAPSRSNPIVDVAYRSNGGSFTPLPRPSYALSADKAFRATASFQLPKPLPKTVELVATPRATWGDGVPPDQSQPRESTTRGVPTCPQAPRSRPVYGRFLPWLSAGLLAVVGTRLLLSLRRDVSRSTLVKSRLGPPLFVDGADLGMAVSAVLLGIICGVLVTLLLIRT